MPVPFPKNWIELQLQAADIEIGAQMSEQLRVLKEYYLIVTRMLQQKFVSGMSCASPVVVSSVASNIESHPSNKLKVMITLLNTK